MNGENRGIQKEQRKELLGVLKERFEKNMRRHEGLEWVEVQTKLEADARKLWSVGRMEETGGEPDIISSNPLSAEYVFYDCSNESPLGRRSVCYDDEALASRKEHKPQGSAIAMATEMGIDILSEAEYRKLQEFGSFDVKTSSWVKTPDNIRRQGGALFCDRRYDTVFVYHNGAESYYAVRGFRGLIRL